MSTQSDPLPTVPVPEPQPVAGGEMPIKSKVTFTEIPGSGGGFSIGMSLHGARMEELNPDAEPAPISIVDVIALAVTHIVRTQPEAFAQSVALVKQTLTHIGKQIEAGVPGQEVYAQADESLDGAISQGMRG